MVVMTIRTVGMAVGDFIGSGSANGFHSHFKIEVLAGEFVVSIQVNIIALHGGHGDNRRAMRGFRVKFHARHDLINPLEQVTRHDLHHAVFAQAVALFWRNAYGKVIAHGFAQ